MPPRQRAIPTDFDSRLARLVAADGRQALAGMSRIGSGRGKGRGNQSVLVDVPEPSGGTDNAHLLVMATVGASLDPGGDHVAFDSIIAQHGFGGVPVQPGAFWIHPVSAVYSLTYRHAWLAFLGGGTIRVELDGTLIPEGMLAEGSEGQETVPLTVMYVAEAGQIGRIRVDHDDAGAQLCESTVWLGIPDPKVADPGSAALGGNAVCVTDPAWVGNPVGWLDGDACWIWDSGGAKAAETRWFEAQLQRVTATPVTIEATADNVFDLWINGEHVLAGTNYTVRYTTSLTLAAGRNLIQAEASNTTPPTTSVAGFRLSIRHATTGEVLLRTSDAGEWDVAAAEPSGWPV